jgi:MPBQ/MSBQ methyltransferase
MKEKMPNQVKVEDNDGVQNITLMIEQKIIPHLRTQYAGVLSESEISQHIDDYVGDRQAQYLVEKIRPLIPPKAKVLDIGCGYGSFVLLSNKNGYPTQGIEVEKFEHEISLERAKIEGVPSSVFSLGSALNLPFEKESFDVVTFWNVLEHVSDYSKALKEAKRVLKKGGMIYIIAPNYCAFRKEAHYLVPWAPFFPKWLANYYLRLLNKNPWFLNNCIFYISIFGIRRKLKKLNFVITTDLSEKIKTQHSFQAQWFNRLLHFLDKIYLKTFFIKAINFYKQHPFTHSIDILAIKND